MHTFDLRPLLTQTGWNGDPGSIGTFVQVTRLETAQSYPLIPAPAAAAAASQRCMLRER